MDLLVLTVLGGAAAFVSGRSSQRRILGTLLLCAALSVQVTFAAVVASDGPECAGAQSDFEFAVIFAPIGLLMAPIAGVAALVFAGVFAYFVSPASLLIRIVSVMSFLILIGLGTGFVVHLDTSAAHRCINF